MKGGNSSNHSIKFALSKITNLLSHPGMQKPYSTTFDNQLIELESVDSTNNYAMARIHEGLASDGMICLAHFQTAGKGQRGRNWQSGHHENLMMSLIIAPFPLHVTQQFLFSAAVALGLLDQIRSVHGGNWAIKWPNDLYWNDRKAGGILIENVVRGAIWSFAVVGIGVNLNQTVFSPDLPHAVSLKQVTGSDFEIVSFAEQLRSRIQSRIADLKNNPGKILEQYNTSLFRIRQPVLLRKKDELITTLFHGVSDQGLLMTDIGQFNLTEVDFVVHT